MDEFLATLTTALVPIIGTLLTALVSWGTVELTKYIKTKTKNETAHNAISVICDTVETTVAKFNQTVIPALKEKAADGKLTQADMSAIKQTAMREVRNQIPAAVNIAAHMSVLSVTELISGKIEKAVGERKVIK